MDTVQKRLSQNTINKEKPSGLLKTLKTLIKKRIKKGKKRFSAKQCTSSVCIHIGIGQEALTRKKNYAVVKAGIGSRPQP